MAKQDIQTIIGSSISKDETLLKNFKSIKSCFVGWVESYNATSGTVNVQPAIQDYIPNDEQNGNNYRNSPLLVNVWVFGTFKSTAIEKGDKAVCFVLDQKSNDFFKCIYDSTISLGFQTFKPKTSAQKSICDCVCIILGDASFQELYEAVSAIDTSLENKADIDGTYPDMTVGNATNVTESINGNPITNIFENDGTVVKNATNSSKLGGINADNYAQLSQVVRTDIAQNLTSTEQLQAQDNIYPTITDLNNVPLPFSICSQIFTFSVNTENAPTTDGGTLIQSVYDNTFQYGFYTQTVFMNTAGGGEIYTRRHNGTNGFTDWKKYISIDPTALSPSTANGWSGGTSTSIPSTTGAYWVKVDNQPITLIAYYVGGDWVSGTTIWYKQA